MNEINIRKAGIDDVPVIHVLLKELERSLGATAKVNRQEEDLRRHGFSNAPSFQALIAWRGIDAVGLALFFPEFSSWKGSPGVYVQDLYVSSDYRGAGLGRVLMQSVYERSSIWGAEYCKLNVHDHNQAAVAFYQTLGFRLAGDERVMLLDGL